MQELKAPLGKFRVVGVDTFVGPREDYSLGDFDSLSQAIRKAKKHAGEMNPVYVYDDNGILKWSGGTS